MSFSDRVRKLVIVGLDRAGKTSILNILNQEYNLMDNIKPTLGVDRRVLEVLGFQIVSFDLGGQEKFRDGYLKDLKIFQGTDTLIFVIDTLDTVRYQEALQYYQEVLKTFKTLKLNPKIVICIHKIDPNLRFDPETVHNIEEVMELFVSASKGYEVTVYITSIYDRSSIIRAFSKNLQELIETIKPLQSILMSLVGLLKLDGAVLFDDKFLIVADYFQDAQAEELCFGTVYNSVYYMSQQNPEYATNLVGNFEIALGEQSIQKTYSFIEVPFKGWNLYLLAMGNQRYDPKTLLMKFESIARIRQ
ncbi:MAG: hypothetical protein HWN65_16165 [Candidatus Helarchaeota archaeon]|nr:hypothetical protein [Candidatus Helarchaeota archaeon]